METGGAGVEEPASDDPIGGILPFVSNLGALGSGEIPFEPGDAGLPEVCLCPDCFCAAETNGFPGSILPLCGAGSGPIACPTFPLGTDVAEPLRLGGGFFVVFGAVAAGVGSADWLGRTCVRCDGCSARCGACSIRAEDCEERRDDGLTLIAGVGADRWTGVAEGEGLVVAGVE